MGVAVGMLKLIKMQITKLILRKSERRPSSYILILLVEIVFLKMKIIVSAFSKNRTGPRLDPDPRLLKKLDPIFNVKKKTRNRCIDCIYSHNSNLLFICGRETKRPTFDLLRAFSCFLLAQLTTIRTNALLYTQQARIALKIQIAIN